MLVGTSGLTHLAVFRTGVPLRLCVVWGYSASKGGLVMWVSMECQSGCSQLQRSPPVAPTHTRSFGTMQCGGCSPPPQSVGRCNTGPRGFPRRVVPSGHVSLCRRCCLAKLCRRTRYGGVWGREGSGSGPPNVYAVQTDPLRRSFESYATRNIVVEQMSVRGLNGPIFRVASTRV